MDDGDAVLHRALVEASTDGLWIFDEHGTTPVRQRPDGPSCSGCEPERDGRLPAVDALDERGPRAAPRPPRRDGVGPRGEPDNVETLLVRPDGTEIWTLVSWSAGPRRRRATGSAGCTGSPSTPSARRSLETLQRPRAAARDRAARSPRSAAGSGTSRPTRVTWSDQLYRIYDLEPRRARRDVRGLPRPRPPRRPASGCAASVESTFAGADEFALRRAGSSAATASVRWVRGLRLRRARRRRDRRCGWAAPPRTSPTWSRRRAGRRGDPAARAAPADGDGGQPGQQPRARRSTLAAGGLPALHHVGGGRRLPGRRPTAP